MLDCGISKAAALIWPGTPESDLNGRSMSQSSGLMRWMSAISDHASHPLHGSNTLTYTMDGTIWNNGIEKLSSCTLSELGLTKASNGTNHNNGNVVVDENSQGLQSANSQLYSSTNFNRNSMSVSNPMPTSLDTLTTTTAASVNSHNNSVGQILGLSQPFKFSNHLQVSNGTGRKYQCKMCPQIFHSKADMQLHTQVHMREAKPYKCSQCTKSFANSSYLSQHTRIHLGIKPYRCEMCQRKFTQLSHLQQHIRTHTGDKPYKCRYPNCSKAFSQLSNLQSHSRSHQTDKPFKCNSCYKCFTDEAGLLDHIPKHKDSKHLKTHICQFCGKSYTQETYLAKHMQKHSDRTEKRNSLQNRALVQMSDNYWQKNSVNTCQSSPIECSNNLINSQQHQQSQQPQQQQHPPQTEALSCSLQSPLNPDNHVVVSSHRFDQHNRLPITNVSQRNSEELIYGVDSKSNANSAFTPLQSSGVRMSYFAYEPFNFPNKTSSGIDAKKTMEVAPKSGHTSFPNQLIALNQIRNYASMPGSVSITSGEHPISLKDD